MSERRTTATRRSTTTTRQLHSRAARPPPSHEKGAVTPARPRLRDDEGIERLFHTARVPDWEQAQRNGVYRVSSLGTLLGDVGFIHLSFAHQVKPVADAIYRGMTDLVLLEVDPPATRRASRDRVAVPPPLRRDPTPGGGAGPSIPATAGWEASTPSHDRPKWLLRLFSAACRPCPW